MTTQLYDRVREAAESQGEAADMPTPLLAAVRRRRRQRRALLRGSGLALIVLTVAITARQVGTRSGPSVADTFGNQGTVDQPLDETTAAWAKRIENEGGRLPSFPEGVPGELRTFVVAKGGLAAVPVVEDPAVVPAEVEVACLSRDGLALTLSAAQACTFVFRYDFADDASSAPKEAERVCLRRKGTAPISACVSNGLGEVQDVPGTDTEAVVYWRSTDLPSGGLRIADATEVWSEFERQPTGFLTWFNCVQFAPCSGHQAGR